MHLDTAAAERFLAFADGNVTVDDVWKHPAYDVAQVHAELLGRDLDRAAVEGAMRGEETTFRHVDDLGENREQVEDLLATVADRSDDWTDRIDAALSRVTPDANISSVTAYLAIGYEFGVGNREGAFLNLNDPLFLEDPTQVCYTVAHECSHVLYDRVHDFSMDLGPADIADPEGQRRVFATLFHTEAFATYTPLAIRREDGALGTHDHPVCADYRVLGDDERLGEHVAAYDDFRARVRTEHIDPGTLLSKLFGGPRLPYRVGCALLDRLERTRGLEAVREAFHVDPETFIETYDDVLNGYRTAD